VLKREVKERAASAALPIGDDFLQTVFHSLREPMKLTFEAIEFLPNDAAR
jgi:hypothetical protein